MIFIFQTIYEKEKTEIKIPSGSVYQFKLEVDLVYDFQTWQHSDIEHQTDDGHPNLKSTNGIEKETLWDMITF